MSGRAPRGFRFGRFRFDAGTYQVFEGDSPLALTPKAIDLLRILLDARGTVVPKNDLLAQLWPDAIVEETNLTQTVFVLRKALQASEGDPEIVSTVARRGYRLAVPVEEDPPASAEPRPAIAHWGRWIAAAIAVVLLGAGVTLPFAAGRRHSPEAAPIRFSIPIPSGWSPGSMALSSNGRQLAFVAARGDGEDMLWLRSLDALAPQLVPDSERAMYPFFSLDGSRVGFFANGRLWIADTAGGRPRAVVEARLGCGGTWLPDGRILFASTPTDGFSVVSPDGTGLAKVAIPPRGMRCSPSALPDGRHFLFFSGDPQGISVGSLDGGAPAFVAPAHASGHYAAGHLLFVLDDRLLAQPFDPVALRVTGDPVPVVQPVAYNRSARRSAFDVSDNGILAYRSGDVLPSQVAWVDREGRQIGSAVTGAYLEPAVSLDGQRIALEEYAAAGHSIWIVNLETGAREAVAPGEIAHTPLWTADSRHVVYSTKDGIYEHAAGTVSPPRRIFDRPPGPLCLFCLARRGGFIVTAAPYPQGWDIWAWPLAHMSGARPLVQGLANEREPDLSPDERLLAYVSDESGSRQVYLQELGGSGTRVLVSPGGGEEPHWRGDGRELFFVRDGAIWSVPVETQPATSAGQPRRLFAVDLAGVSMFRSRYQVAPDGQRLLVCRSVNADRSIVVVTSWQSMLH
jgi:DNA-binding winged helix-turn-helix (wHTH) protein/Tol biopolymer transport system component